jgi:8-amino-7-oxononanoate synthase
MKMDKTCPPLLRKVVDYKDAEEVRAMDLYPYFRPIQSDQNTEVLLDGKKVLMFGSNSYLGLTCHPKVKEGAIKAIQKYGTGCGGSRFLNGTLDIHIECEEKIAEFMGKEGCLLFATGMQANLGGISALASGRNDHVLLDKFDHASILDGAKLGMGRVSRFQHNDLDSLKQHLTTLGPGKSTLIVVDGVFSMHGDIAPLPGIVKLAEEHGAALMVDEAHGIGVLGKQGRGTCDHFGVTDKVDLIMGTFSKSLATVGGFLAGDAAMMDYLKHNSRALIFSASIAPANVGAVLAALDIMKSEPERIQHLWDNTRRMKDGLIAAGFNVGPTETPILPVIIGDDLVCFKMCKMLQKLGVFVSPVVRPAVEPGHSLLRVSLMATHTYKQIDHALDLFQETGRKLGVLTDSSAPHKGHHRHQGA